MPVPAVLTAWLVLAAVLAASGVGKARHPEDAAEVTTAWDLPTALIRPWMVRAHPWLELALAAGLLLLPHPLSVVGAAVVLVVLLGYLLLVCRVVASGVRVSCHCFGAVGGGVVDGWTVVRNAVLAVLGAVVLVDAALGQSVPSRVADLGGSSVDGAWWWVAALAVTVLVTWLVVRPGSTTDRRRDRLDPGADPPPALRVPVPDVPVRRAAEAAPVSLRDLARDQRQVLLLLSPGCGPCRMLSNHLASWAHAVPDTGFVVAHAVSFSVVRESLPEWEPFFVQDIEGAVARAFDDPARPWAVVLGTDGRIDSAPAQGYAAIVRLVEGLRPVVPAPGDSSQRAGAR